MEIGQLKGVSVQTVALLGEAGLTTVEDLRLAGRDGLIAIKGIGPRTADTILSLLPPPPPRPNRRVTVRNDRKQAVLVGEKYMFPEDIREIFAFQVVDGLTILEDK